MNKLSQYMKTFILLFTLQIYIGVMCGIYAANYGIFPFILIIFPFWILHTMNDFNILSTLYGFEQSKLKEE